MDSGFDKTVLPATEITAEMLARLQPHYRALNCSYMRRTEYLASLRDEAERKQKAYLLPNTRNVAINLGFMAQIRNDY